MSKHRGEDNQRQSPGKRSRPAPKKHLYLVLDDWEKGYSIRKIDPDALRPISDGSTCTEQGPEQLPEPAAFRFVAPAFGTQQFVAMGSNIVIVSSGGGETDDQAPPTLVYDTEAAALAIGPALPGRPSGLNVAVAGGGDALYALTTLGAGLPLAFEAFSWARCTRDEEEPGRPTHEWSWKSVAAPPPPFAPGDAVVSAYAVHPDGRTIFVSTTRVAEHGSHRGNGGSTYSFDTTRREWRCHGAWVLPFQGQGYFDRELDAWVGLHREKQGYICACQVASRSGTATAAADADELELEEKLFCKGGEDTPHLEATLTYMGDSRFCLAESVALKDDVKTGHACNGCMARVTTFGLKFIRKGKLQITSHRTSNSYVVSKCVPSFYPLAFWM